METLQTLWRSIDWELLGSLISRVLAVFLCLTVHETCHGLAAYALGDPTAKRQHRLSFNPLRHIDWLGFASMLIVGFGWAKPVPVDMRYFKKPKQGMAITALAGPVSNFLLAVLCLLREGPKELSGRLVDLGIRGFWNFSHYDLSIPYPNVTVENAHLGDSLMSLGYRLRND